MFLSKLNLKISGGGLADDVAEYRYDLLHYATAVSLAKGSALFPIIVILVSTDSNGNSLYSGKYQYTGQLSG